MRRLQCLCGLLTVAAPIPAWACVQLTPTPPRDIIVANTILAVMGCISVAGLQVMRRRDRFWRAFPVLAIFCLFAGWVWWIEQWDSCATMRGRTIAAVLIATFPVAVIELLLAGIAMRRRRSAP